MFNSFEEQQELKVSPKTKETNSRNIFQIKSSQSSIFRLNNLSVESNVVQMTQQSQNNNIPI